MDYPQVIKEDPQEPQKLQKPHRYGHLFHGLKMPTLLKAAG
jgi:hypothetical protein